MPLSKTMRTSAEVNLAEGPKKDEKIRLNRSQAKESVSSNIYILHLLVFSSAQALIVKTQFFWEIFVKPSQVHNCGCRGRKSLLIMMKIKLIPYSGHA